MFNQSNVPQHLTAFREMQTERDVHFQGLPLFSEEVCLAESRRGMQAEVSADWMSTIRACIESVYGYSLRFIDLIRYPRLP